MALCWLEGFDNYGASGMSDTTLITEMAKRYSSYILTSTTPYTELVAGWGGGLGLQFGRSGDTTLHLSVSFASNSNWLVGCAFKTPSLFTTKTNIFAIRSSTAGQNSLAVTSTGLLAAYSGDDSSPVFLASASQVLLPNTWYYIEYKVYCHASAGTVDVHLNGVSVISLTSKNTLKAGGDCTVVRLRGIPGAATVARGPVDDWYIANGATDFLGPLKVETLRPSADTLVVDWLCSVGSDHYALVNETPDNTGTYVYCGTSGDEDQYEINDLGDISSSIKGVQIGATANLASNGSQQLYLECDSNGSVANSAGVTLTTTVLLTSNYILETDPATSAAWSADAVNDLKVGIKAG